MKRGRYITALLLVVMTTAKLHALIDRFDAPSIPAFSRYQSILQRMPFGAPPTVNSIETSPFDAKAAALEQRDKQLLARKINMSCVNITPGGTIAVGFSDLSVKPAANYYMLVGDDANGWKVLDANYEDEWAELEKEGIVIYVKLGQGLMAEPPVKTEKIQKVQRERVGGLAEAGLLHKANITPKNTSRNNIAMRTFSELAENKKVTDTKSGLKREDVKSSSYTQRLSIHNKLKNEQRADKERITRAQLQEIALKIAREEIENKANEIISEMSEANITEDTIIDTDK